MPQKTLKEARGCVPANLGTLGYRLFFFFLRQSEHTEILNKQDKELFSLNHVKASCLPDASLSLDTLGCHPAGARCHHPAQNTKVDPGDQSSLGLSRHHRLSQQMPFFRRTPFRNLCCTQLLCLLSLFQPRKFLRLLCTAMALAREAACLTLLGV